MNPILHKIGTIFIPVSDIQKARDWYCDLFDLSTNGRNLIRPFICHSIRGYQPRFR